MKKAVAWILRFKNLLSLFKNLSQKSKQLKAASDDSNLNEQHGSFLEKEMDAFKGQIEQPYLSLEELEMAELEIIRHFQEKVFSDELASLKGGESIKK